MGVGPVCLTSLPTGFSECELGPHHVELSPVSPPLTFHWLEQGSELTLIEQKDYSSRTKGASRKGPVSMGQRKGQ